MAILKTNSLEGRVLKLEILSGISQIPEDWRNGILRLLREIVDTEGMGIIEAKNQAVRRYCND